MKQLVTYLLLLISFPAIATWEPPVSPDPRAILNEARADAFAKRYETALAKHLWFHNNALKYKRSFYGVRLSFALSYWVELGEKYPPALDELKKVRNSACAKVKKETSPYQHFHDCSSINQYLNEPNLTIDTFIWLEKNKPELAKKAYSIAEDSLIKAKRFKICGKYLTPRATYDNSVNHYHSILESYNDEILKNLGPEVKTRFIKHAEFMFLEDVATLIALLVHTDRKDEAEKYYKEALVESESANTNLVLNNALKGIFPRDK